ncbi:MAG: hypothetical protein CMD58_00145 [Gammaproteobacteria bacterium]|nr:hypothetical protein [Gammaproteobacteria bacterium]
MFTNKANISQLHRFEKKFIMYNPIYTYKFIKSIFSKDLEYSENYIFNIYFDDSGLRTLYEKLDGDLHRHKIRVRWYASNPELYIPENAKLENKTKFGTGTFKKSCSIEMPSDNISKLLSRKTWKKKLFYHLSAISLPPNDNFLPVMISRYRRRRFIDLQTDSRISFDDDICSLALAPNIYARGITIRKLKNAVLEIKNTNDKIPELLKNQPQIRVTSFSKYGLLLEP